MIRRSWLAYLVVGRTFGSWLKPILTFFLFSVLRLVVTVTMLLDWAFFPRLRRTKVIRPIVIVGNPRTGSTFLHRFLVDLGIGSGCELWRMLYPSCTLQALLRPIMPLLEKISPARHHSTVAHETSLSSVETDDAAIFLRYFDGFFLYGFLLAWARQDLLKLFDPSTRDTSERDFGWLEKVWRRILLAHHSDRIIGKLFSLSARLPAFLQRFPDARILYTVRDPVSVIPSGLSLVVGVLDKRFGFWRLPEGDRRRFLERLYAAFVQLFRQFHDDFTGGRIPTNQVMIVSFDRLMGDFDGLMRDILTFLEIEPTTVDVAEIARCADKQRNYKSKHQYDLKRFGLDAARIRKDCDFVYSTFLTPDPGPAK